jgi:putative protein kinase ArgK-like GTPase of G3E family
MRPRPPGGSFRLSETQSDLIFQDDIVPHLAGAEPQSQPILIVVSGQPGAGKTVLTDALRDRFADAGGATSVDIDML